MADRFFSGGLGQTELRPYQPNLRDRAAQGLLSFGMPRGSVQGLLGSTGLGSDGMGLVDTPALAGGLLGVPFAVDEAARTAGTPEGTLNAMAVMPGAKPAAALAGDVASTVAKRGDEILGLLRAGRGREVTDEMLVMGDPAETARLNAYLYDNYDLPMDEASRMARAREMGFDTDAYHADLNGNDIYAFRPGMWGSTYFAASPSRAERGALAGSNELSHLSNSSRGGPLNTAITPVRLPGDQVAGLRPSRAEWDALPPVTDEAGLPRDAAGGAWYDAYDEQMVRAPEYDADGYTVPGTGEFSYRRMPYPAQEYTPDVGPWQSSQRHLPGYGSDDRGSLARLKGTDQSGFLVSDEAGASIVADPTRMPLRSRWARFDPRLSHLRNLSAGLAGGAVGLGAMGGLLGDPQQAQAAPRELLGYSTGGGF